MQNVLIVIHLIIVVALVGVVLLQRSEGGGLGMGSGGGGVGGFMTGRGQANALTRATAILAGRCHLAFETTRGPESPGQWLAVAGLGLLTLLAALVFVVTMAY